MTERVPCVDGSCGSACPWWEAVNRAWEAWIAASKIPNNATAVVSARHKVNQARDLAKDRCPKHTPAYRSPRSRGND